MSIVIEPSAIEIRVIDRIEELRNVEALQKDVWGCADLDVVPLTLLLASREVGGVLIGAYDESKLIGFVYGFPGYEHGRLTHHSHMLAVQPAYRNHSLGYKLKLAQREAVRAQGINRITWTFDPLQSLNAYFNFAKLGVIADAYRINFYGEATSSFLHQFGTDRLWVTWKIDSRRVRERVAGKKSAPMLELNQTPCLLEVGADQAPRKSESNLFVGRPHLSIAIPADINELQNRQPDLAMSWREVTRWAFTKTMALGYFVEDFYRSASNGQSVGIYLLTYRKQTGDSSPQQNGEVS
ncbi:MAG TPA: GNAT family N-acetyltransferase [Pyrinomonadaceae bacterium]|nr:GNAT family N-acetyltransferase [Pyrinomonadaceae bacterium]